MPAPQRRSLELKVELHQLVSPISDRPGLVEIWAVSAQEWIQLSGAFRQAQKAPPPNEAHHPQTDDGRSGSAPGRNARLSGRGLGDFAGAQSSQATVSWCRMLPLQTWQWCRALARSASWVVAVLRLLADPTLSAAGRPMLEQAKG